MTQEQRDLTRNALRKYGERHWARTPENRRWQSAIDEGIDYYQVHDPMRADLLRMRFFVLTLPVICPYDAWARADAGKLTVCFSPAPQ